MNTVALVHLARRQVKDEIRANTARLQGEYPERFLDFFDDGMVYLEGTFHVRDLEALLAVLRLDPITPAILEPSDA
jgi:hypothetical protein